MRRAVLALIATAAGVVGLLQYKTSSAPSQFRVPTAAAAPPADTPAAETSPSPSPSPAASAPPAPRAGATAAPAAPTPAAPVARTISGSVVSNQFGDVQVTLVVRGGKITDVQTPLLPNDRPRSQYISSVAGPILRQETLQAQSAQIDGVSGATYTSYSFYQSLQAALAKAGM